MAFLVDSPARQRSAPESTWHASDRWLVALQGLSLIGVMATLVAALLLTPPDVVEGNVFRILYVHVATAWNAYAAFFVVFVASIIVLWKRSLVWDRVARVSAEIGLLFTTLVL